MYRLTNGLLLRGLSLCQSEWKSVTGIAGPLSSIFSTVYRFLGNLRCICVVTLATDIYIVTTLDLAGWVPTKMPNKNDERQIAILSETLRY